MLEHGPGGLEHGPGGLEHGLGGLEHGPGGLEHGPGGLEHARSCQIWTKIMKNDPNQVPMAPFGLIINSASSYRVCGAKNDPPGL